MLLLNSKGMLYGELLPQGHTIIAVAYATHLHNLAEAVPEERP